MQRFLVRSAKAKLLAAGYSQQFTELVSVLSSLLAVGELAALLASGVAVQTGASITVNLQVTPKRVRSRAKVMAENP